jgi:hypothetical protein
MSEAHATGRSEYVPVQRGQFSPEVFLRHSYETGAVTASQPPAVEDPYRYEHFVIKNVTGKSPANNGKVVGFVIEGQGYILEDFPNGPNKQSWFRANGSIPGAPAA